MKTVILLGLTIIGGNRRKKNISGSKVRNLNSSADG